MAGLERRKRRRDDEFTMSINRIKGAMDLFVPTPAKDSTNATKQNGNTIILPQSKLLEQLLSRLQDTGYSYIALTHTITGHPRDPDDRANIAIPNASNVTGVLRSNVTLLRRLHIIVENQSDMRIFNPQSIAQRQLLAEYDLISIAPRSDVVFQEACTCDNIDIVTLDGTMSTSNFLPYTIRSTDIRAIRNRHAVLEIPYSVPILNRNARKGLVQTCRSVITASLGGGSDVPTSTSMIPVLFSSGNRSTFGSNTNTRQSDVGSVALRTPDDLVNVLQSVLSFDTKTGIRSVTESGQAAIKHGIARRRQYHELDKSEASHHQSITVIGIGLDKRRKRPKTGSIFETSPNHKTDGYTTSVGVPNVSKTSSSVNNTFCDENDASDDEGFIAL